MSWKHDRELSERLGQLRVQSYHRAENRMVGHAKPMYGETTLNCFAVFSVAHPSATLIQATSCTFEYSQVVDIFLQWTANSSALTFSDFLFWGRVNCMTYTGDHSPPDLAVYMQYTAISFPDQGMAYFVLKNNISIGGVPFCSTVARTGVR